MDTYRAATTRRTIRLFQQKPIGRDLIERMFDAGRLAPSGGNRQVVEFIAVTEPQNRQRLFEHLAWAAYVVPKRTPPPDKRPMAYVVVLVRAAEPKGVNSSDAAAAMENMILTAWSEGVGSCWIGSVDRTKAAPLLGVPDGYTIFGVLALGYPAEKPVTEVLTDSVKYWLDENDVLHVPKKPLCEIAHYEKFTLPTK